LEERTKEALYWTQDYLARRPHSEKELVVKLQKKGFELSTAKEAVQFAKEQNWMDDPFELAEKVYLEWDRKNKSHNWIINYLNEKALPLDHERNSQRETDKALYHLQKRFESFSHSEHNKAASNLSSKGFLYEDFNNAIEIFKTLKKGPHEEL